MDDTFLSEFGNLSKGAAAGIARRVERERCERHFSAFVAAAWEHVDTSTFVHNWHIDVLADHLQGAYEGTSHNHLCINISPAAGKSLIVNVLFPAWVWTQDKTKRIISVSHKERLAIRDSTKCRRLIQSAWYQSHWPIALRSDQNAKASFENESSGAREAMPLASMTGNRGNVVIVDDPLSVKDAKSAAYRTAAAENFFEGVPTRLNNSETDMLVVVMQRLHEEDITGLILANKDLEFDHLCIPLLADGIERPPTSLGWIDPRAEGENMFPARYSDKVIRRFKASLGPFAFSGQFQQAPVPADDGFFKREWFHRYAPADLPKDLHYYMTSDHAPSSTGDFNVVRVWAIDPYGSLWLVDSFRKKCQMDEALGIIRTEGGKTKLAATGALPFVKRYKPLCWFPENDNTWVAIRQWVDRAMLDTEAFCRIATMPTKGSGDKIGKAQAYQAMAAVGKIYLPEGQIGDDALTEYCSFPLGRNDDQVDADGMIARAIGEAMPAFLPQPSQEVEFDPYEDRPSYATTDSDSVW